jgi:hypothetical protein
MKPLVILTFAVLLASCNSEKPVENPVAGPPAGVEITVPDSITQTFTLPDSINTGLIIATYVEIDPESHTLIMYAKVDKKKAMQVRYLNDGKVSTEELSVISETQFKTKSGNEFIITDSSVVYKPTSGTAFEHYRTDANN